MNCCQVSTQKYNDQASGGRAPIRRELVPPSLVKYLESGIVSSVWLLSLGGAALNSQGRKPLENVVDGPELWKGEVFSSEFVCRPLYVQKINVQES